MRQITIGLGLLVTSCIDNAPQEDNSFRYEESLVPLESPLLEQECEAPPQLWCPPGDPYDVCSCYDKESLVQSMRIQQDNYWA